MAWDKGFNFRDTAGYVTDGANESPVLGEVYPHTYSNGATAGWATSNISHSESYTTYGRRVAGGNYVIDPNFVNTFIVDIPGPGDYAVAFILGTWQDPPALSFAIKDASGTSLTPGKYQHKDLGLYERLFADDTIHPFTDCEDADVLPTYTVTVSSGTQLKFELTADTYYAVINHLFISQISGGGGGGGGVPFFFQSDLVHGGLQQLSGGFE